MKPQIVAHRGASKLALENTRSAFEKAILCGADAIELDVRLTKDGEIVVFHDKTLKRIVGKRTYISKMTLPQIKEITLSNGETIPTLSEALACIDKRCRVNIEVKTATANKALLQRLLCIIRKYGMVDMVLISSFSHSFLRELKKLEPHIETAALFVRKRDVQGYVRRSYFTKTIIKKAKKINASAVNMQYRFVSKKLVDYAHEQQLKINVWTVDTYEIAKRLFRLGIDGLITNKPKTFSKIVSGKL